MVLRHHIDGSRMGVERLRDVAQFDHIPAAFARDRSNLGLSLLHVLYAVLLRFPVVLDSPETREIEAVPERQRPSIGQLDFGILLDGLFDIGPRQLFAHAGGERLEVATLHAASFSFSAFLMCSSRAAKKTLRKPGAIWFM